MGQRNPKDRAEASGPQKLERLLATESELEEMLAQTRLEAAQIVEAAQRDVDARLGRFESSLESETRALRERIERERDETVASIRADGERQVTRLDALDDASIAALARHVLSLLLGETEKADAP